MLRVCRRAVEVVAVDQPQNVPEDAALTSTHLRDVVAVSRDDDQVGQLTEPVGLAKCAHQAFEVLSLVCSGQREDHRLARIGQKAVELAGDARA